MMANIPIAQMIPVLVLFTLLYNSSDLSKVSVYRYMNMYT